MIRDNLEQVRQKIKDACDRAGRDAGEVTLISVSKTKPLSMLEEAYEAGARDFGENKVQELLEKIPQMPKDVRWHMIGHLQRNKVKYIVGKVSLIHSVDSLRLAEEISREAVKQDTSVDILAPYVENAEDNRQYFRKLKQLSVDIEQKNIDNVNMNVLSMGMTGDYSVAVEEGATCVRVGTGIFGERDYVKGVVSE